MPLQKTVGLEVRSDEFPEQAKESAVDSFRAAVTSKRHITL